jgi:phospholipid/cholesterol/gamma-HCH transport system substrate-binding protein
MKREVIVGAFVLFGLAVTGASIYVIGQERRVFDPKIEYQASFPDVQGLKPGAPVRLGGVDIGTVISVRHGPNTQDDRLYVKMEIVREEASRIREDSTARVANKGLLGDKMMEITPGTPGRAQLPPGSAVHSEDPPDYTNLLNQVGEVAKKTEAIATNLEKTTATFADEGMRSDMRESMRSVTVILNNVAQSKGYAGKLLNDPAEAERISQTFAKLDQTAARMNGAIDGFNKIINQVNHGPGFAHSLVYDEEGTKTLKQIGGAADEVAQSLKGIREGNGLARGLLYGGPGQEKANENLTAMSGDLRAIVADVRAGKGTIGGLLVDPSIYEDMKSLLGNVQRNDVLRALVRYSIKEDEKRPKVEVAAPPAGSGRASAAK